MQIPPLSPELIDQLSYKDAEKRVQAARILSYHAAMQIAWVLNIWRKDAILDGLIVQEWIVRPRQETVVHPRLTTGIAVLPVTFEKIRAANGSPPLAGAPADQDALEFELEFPGEVVPQVRLDILTTKAPGAGGAIDRFLLKFGEAIQQVEVDVTDVDRATEILRTRFQVEPVYPATRAGADGTRINFFLIPTWDSKKALVELVEHPKGSH
jgi:hypothetical protein